MGWIGGVSMSCGCQRGFNGKSWNQGNIVMDGAIKVLRIKKRSLNAKIILNVEMQEDSCRNK